MGLLKIIGYGVLKNYVGYLDLWKRYLVQGDVYTYNDISN